MAYDMSEYNEISSVKASNNEVFNFADTLLRETVSQLSSNSSTITIDGDVSDLSIANVTIGEYKQLLSTRTILSNELYVIRNEGYVDAYGEKIKHVAPGTELSDAVNVEQLQNAAAELENFLDKRYGGEVSGDVSIIGKFSGGNDAYVAGEYGFAYGNNVSSIGTAAHAEGGDNLSGKPVGEGEELLYSEARGYASHSEGAGLAIGRYSHAEGGGNSIIEGFATRSTAEGAYSHAEGTHTWAKGANSHTEGSNTYVKTSTSHAEGKNNIIGNAAADRGPISAISYVENKGVHSHVEGQGNFIIGGNAHAEGKGNIVEGHNSHVEGEFNKVIGRTSHAAGISAIAYHDNTFIWNGISAESFSTSSAGTFNINPVNGEDGIKIGSKTLSEVIDSHQTSSFTALTIGSRASGKTIGSPSLVVGQQAAATAAGVAIGYQSESTANNTLANGQLCKAGGAASHAEGYGSQTTQQRSHADGYYAKANHAYSYVWNGDTSTSTTGYASNGVGTYSINPVDSINGFYIGSKTLAQYLDEACDVSAAYQNKHIKLSANGQVVGDIDCADFIKDGMLSTAELCGTQLIFKFNTEADSHPISVELSNFVDDYNLTIEEISNKIDNKIIIDDRISGIVDQSDLSVIKLSASEYEQLVYDDRTLSNILYIVDKDYLDQYGQQIKNLGAPTDLSDAVTKEYVDNSLQNVQIPTDLSDFTNSPNFATQGYVNQVLGDIETILNNL